MPKNRLTKLNLAEINRDMRALHSELLAMTLSLHDNSYEIALERIDSMLVKYMELRADFILNKNADYSYVSDKILTAIVNKLDSYTLGISGYKMHSYSGHRLSELLRYISDTPCYKDIKSPLACGADSFGLFINGDN